MDSVDCAVIVYCVASLLLLLELREDVELSVDWKLVLVLTSSAMIDDNVSDASTWRGAFTAAANAAAVIVASESRRRILSLGFDP